MAGMERVAWRRITVCDSRCLAEARREDVQEGRQATRGGMWVVREVLQIRYPAAGRRGSQLEVKVLWGGQWRDHQCEWVPVTWLNARAKQQARCMEERGKRRREEATFAEGAERRVSPRVAGSVPTIGLPERKKRERRIEEGGVSARGAGKAPKREGPFRKTRARSTEGVGEKERPRVNRRTYGAIADKTGGKRRRVIVQERARTRART